MQVAILILLAIAILFVLASFLRGRSSESRSVLHGVPSSTLPGRPSATWLALPAWPKEPINVEVSSHSRNIAHQVNLTDNSCTCEKWLDSRKSFPVGDIRRICRHIAQAIISHQNEYAGGWNKWTLHILNSMAAGASHGICARFETATFSNGEQEFLAIYNCATAYTDLYGEQGGFFGYLGRGNRWAWGEGPEHPLELKKTLRPWIARLDLKYRVLQEEYARQQDEQRKRDLAKANEKQRSENESASFPLDLLPNAYRMQDFDRIHPGWIQFRKPVTVHVELISRALTDETKEIVASITGLAPFEDEGDGFFHLKLDGKDLLLRFDPGRQSVRVVFQRNLKRKIDYSHEKFLPGECRCGREGTAPPRLLFVRGLIYDFLHGKPIEGDRIDFELSNEPYMPRWDEFKAHPLDRAPYPPVP